MTRVSRQTTETLRGRPFALIAAAGVLGLAVSAAQAQTVPGLRASMQDPATTGSVSTAATQADPYVPIGPGGAPDDPATDDPANLFGGVEGEDAFENSEAVAPARPAAQGAASVPAARQQAQGRVLSVAEQQELAEGIAEAESTTRSERASRAERLTTEDAGRVEPIEGIDPRPEEDAFAPLGVRVGTFILRPSLEQGLTSTSNADLSPNGESAILSETTLRLNAVSDWSRHSASLDAYGNFRRSISGADYDDTSAGLDGVLDLDILEDLRGRATIGYERRPETASSPVVIEGTVSEPWRQTFSGSLGLAKDVGKARYGITGRVEHDDYGDAELQDGTILSQADRNATLATIVLRGGYEISPALTPFVEGEVGRRTYDETVDASGFRRSSDRLGLRAGVEVDLGEKLIGEVSGGWIRESFDDERLEAIEAPSVDASLTWSPERGTDVALAASTTIEDTTTAGESGSVVHGATVSVARRIRSDLTGTALARINYRDYSGSSDHDLLLTAEVGATWWLNRYAGITGRLRHESQKSSIENRDYDANSVFLGLRLQR